MNMDMRVLELLASKLCHDLISPVSAINNGVELIEDIGGSVVDEAMKLIANSAGHASRRLRLFRIAYGRAGSEDNISARDVRQVAEQYMGGGKVALHWPEELVLSPFFETRGSLKALLNLLMLGEEILAYGGTIRLGFPGEEGGEGCRLEIAGRNAQLSQVFQEALNGDTPVEDLTPRTVQAYVTGRFAAHFGLRIASSQPEPERLDLLLTKGAA